MMKMHMIAANRALGKAGFTLVEALMAVVISGILMVGVYSAYVIQQKSYVVQEQVAETQENLRAAMFRLLSEIRQAGCDPTRSAGARILQATRTSFHFTADIGGDPVNPNMADGLITPARNEDITFGLRTAANANPLLADANGNGIADDGGVDWSVPGQLGRDDATGAGMQPVAELIDALEFNYILAGGASTTAPVSLSDIRAVQVSLLARGARPDPKFVDRSTYTTASGVVWAPPNDNFRRRFVIVTIQLRNLGL